MSLERKTYLEDELSKINKSVKFIDCGGCGIFASYLYHALREKGLKPKIHMVTNPNASMLKINSTLKNNKKVDENKFNTREVARLDWTHFMIKLDGYLIDNNGVFEKIEKHTDIHYIRCKISRATVSIEILDSLNYDFILWWNNTYKRKNNMVLKNKIKKMVKNLVD